MNCAAPGVKFNGTIGTEEIGGKQGNGPQSLLGRVRSEPQYIKHSNSHFYSGNTQRNG